MIPFEALIALLRRLDQFGMGAQWGALAAAAIALLVVCGLALGVAYRLGKRNTVDLEEEIAALKKAVAKQSKARAKLAQEDRQLGEAIEGLEAERPEAGLERAEREAAAGNIERAIRGYQGVFTQVRPDLARCCGALAAAEEPASAERYRALARQLAAAGGER